MATGGKYPKGVAKQDELVNVALALVAERGYNAATIREVAEAAGLSKTGLLHHFNRKEDLFVEVLRRRDRLVTDKWMAGRNEPPESSADFVAGFVQENADAPGLVQLFTRLSAEATDPAHPSHDYFRERYKRNQAASAGLVSDMKARGEVPESVDSEKLAVILAALIEGIQLRWLYDPSIDMAEHVRHLLTALASSSTTPE